MTLKRYDSGPAVTEVQTMLLALGYPLPRFGADGNLGLESLGAMDTFLREHKEFLIHPDDDTMVFADEEIELLRRVYGHPSPILPPETAGLWVDRRSFASNKRDYGVRPWTRITGTCLHQTACEMGEREGRYNEIGAHFVVLPSGKALWMHDLTRLIVAANGWNTQTVSIEIVGLFAGIEGDPHTVWDDPSTKLREIARAPTEAQMNSTRWLVRWIHAEIARHGGKHNALVAHRQASASRESDPGSAIWNGVALPLHAELGLTDGGVGFTLGDGLPIPESWDPRCVGIPYRR